MPKERQVAASISTKGEAVGSGDGANGRTKEIESKKCNLGGTSKLGEHEESGAAAKEQHKGEENPKAVAEEEYGENMWDNIASAAFSNPTSATGECDWLTLHRRMGHVALPILQQLVKNEMVAGIGVKGEPDEVLGCPTCMQAKFTRYPFSSSEATAKAPIDEVVMDVVGPLKLGAARAEYFLTIVDVYTRMTWVYVLSKKSDVAETVKTDWLPMVERQQDRLVKAIRTDRGGEFLSKEFSLWLKKNGIRHSLTMPYSPAMNSIAERANRTITETARGLLIEAGLLDYFWPDAVRSAYVAKNRALTHVGARKWVPYVEWIGRKPKVDMLRVFGCMCMALVPKHLRHNKLGAKAIWAVHLGVAQNSKGWLLWDPFTKKFLLPAAACLSPAYLPACCLLAACCHLPPACRLRACLLAACCRLPAACLLPDYCLLPTAACLLAACCRLPAACLLPACCLPTACCLLPPTCLLPAATCLPPACSLPAACLLLACCLLPAAACLLAACCRLPANMATPNVLAFEPDGRPIEFTVWLDDLQLFLLTDVKEGISLFDYVSSTAVTLAADAHALERSQWQTRDAAARLAIRNHLPITERAHFSQHRTAKTLDHFLALDPTTLTVDDFEKHLLAAEKNILAVGAARGTPRSPLFEGCSPSPLTPSYASVAAAHDYLGAEGSELLPLLVGSVAEAGAAGVAGAVGVAVEVAVVQAAGEVEVVGVVVGVEAVEVVVGAAEALGAVEGAAAAVREEEAVVALVVRVSSSRSSSSSISINARPPLPISFLTGMPGVGLLGVLRATFPDATEFPNWADLLRRDVPIYDLDYEAILAAMYALSVSAEGDCYLCVPPDPGIAPGIAPAALVACESAPLGTAPAQALHTFTLDSGASRCFFRDSTTVNPLPTHVPVSLADPSGGPVLAWSSTVLPCPAVPSGKLPGLHLPSFSTNLVSNAILQDAAVDTFTPGRQRVAICTCSQTGRHLATFARASGSSLYTLTTASRSTPLSPQLHASAQVATQCECRRLSHDTLLWHHRLGHPSLPRLRNMHSRFLVSGLPRSLPPLPLSPAPPSIPCVEGRQRAAPHSSSFPPTEAPLQTLHLDVWGPTCVRGQGHERYFLLVVDDYTRYTTEFPLQRKADVSDVLIPWIRATRLQLRERFQSDFHVLRLHSDRGGQFS
ncbi:unnamed protein product [Closterium sp. NIES-54]